MKEQPHILDLREPAAKRVSETPENNSDHQPDNKINNIKTLIQSGFDGVSSAVKKLREDVKRNDEELYKAL
ncbi:MAG: hypothetical protein MUC28_03855 [Planctomycetes bacterium]|jgi:hypothetical protein|nr:hypothetical protein [Planctomycetota bacterium]